MSKREMDKVLGHAAADTEIRAAAAGRSPRRHRLVQSNDMIVAQRLARVFASAHLAEVLVLENHPIAAEL